MQPSLDLGHSPHNEPTNPHRSESGFVCAGYSVCDRG
jgi:hypothetical protein